MLEVESKSASLSYGLIFKILKQRCSSLADFPIRVNTVAMWILNIGSLRYVVPMISCLVPIYLFHTSCKDDQDFFQMARNPMVYVLRDIILDPK